MAHPPRISSLDEKASLAYRFGNVQTNGMQDGNLTANPLPRTMFDNESKSSSHEEFFNEKTGYTTPNSDTDRPFAYSYQHAPGKNQHIPQHLSLYTKNEWTSTIGTGEEDDDLCPARCKEIIASRAFKRWAIVYILGVVMFWIWFFRYYSPEQKKAIASTFLMDSLKGRFLEESEFGYFGTNRRVEFLGMQHMEVLDRALVPGSEKPGVANRRLIVIGDIHGCADELELLLKQVSFDSSKDHIITTGDMISKGPASPKVLDVLIHNNASCVRGNNEDRVLHAYRDHHAPSHQKILAADSPRSEPSAISLKHGHSNDLALAASLSAQQISYLASCPLIINLGPISSMGANTSIVHAGLIPGVALEKQDPSAIMTMRSIDLRNQVPSPNRPPDPSTGPPPRPRSRLKKPDYTNWDDKGRLAVLPWGRVWDEFQDLIPSLLAEGKKRERNPPPAAPPPETNSKRNRKPAKRGTTKINPYKDLVQTSVIHGHDSQHGVVEGKWHYGLDGGCFRGGVLAALVLEESNFLSSLGGRRVRKNIVTVPCQQYQREVGGTEMSGKEMNGKEVGGKEALGTEASGTEVKKVGERSSSSQQEATRR